MLTMKEINEAMNENENGNKERFENGSDMRVS